MNKTYKPLLSIIIIFFLCIQVQAQEEVGLQEENELEEFHDMPTPFVKNGKFGLKYSSGEIHLSPIYDEMVRRYDDHNTKIVRLGRQWGVIDGYGKLLSPLLNSPRIELLTLNSIIDLNFNYLDSIKDSLVPAFKIIVNGKQIVLNYVGKEMYDGRGFDLILPQQSNYNYAVVVENEKVGFLSSSVDTLLIPANYLQLIWPTETVSQPLTDNLGVIIGLTDSSSVIFDFNKNTKIEVPYQATDLIQKKWLVIIKNGMGGFMKYPELELITDIAYSHLRPYPQDSSLWEYKPKPKRYSSNNYFGLMDSTGKKITSPDYFSYRTSKESKYIIALKADPLNQRNAFHFNKYFAGVLDKGGTEIVPFEYKLCPNNLKFCFSNNDKIMAFYGQDYKQVTPFKYTKSIFQFNDTKTISILAESKDDKFNFLSIDSNNLVTTWEYDSVNLTDAQKNIYITQEKSDKNVKKGLVIWDQDNSKFVLLSTPKYASIKCDDPKLNSKKAIALATTFNGIRYIISSDGELLEISN